MPADRGLCQGCQTDSCFCGFSFCHRQFAALITGPARRHSGTHRMFCFFSVLFTVCFPRNTVLVFQHTGCSHRAGFVVTKLCISRVADNTRGLSFQRPGCWRPLRLSPRCGQRSLGSLSQQLAERCSGRRCPGMDHLQHLEVGRAVGGGQALCRGRETQ